MTECRTRKGPRRPRRRERASDDYELVELTTIIVEHTLDQNAAGWFLLPWRDGWNAVELAFRASGESDGWLEDVIQHRRANSEIYWISQEKQPASPMLRLALRCLQVLVANSSGGGEVYNAILVTAFEAAWPETVAPLVLEYRCRDSIGVSAHIAGDENDRLRRAFSTAWKRGLYHAAYALPRAKTMLVTIGKRS